MNRLYPIALAVALVGPVQGQEQQLELGDKAAKVNYSVGYQIGSDFEYQGVEIRREVILQGIRDALSGAAPALSREQMRVTMADLGKRVAELKQEQRRQLESTHQYLRSGAEFLAENAQKEGVVVTTSGLQYKVLREGTGKTPKATDTVRVNYRGVLTDGKEFDSSYSKGEPATFRVDKVIPGWSEALQLMKEGAKWQLFIPPKLAYGEKSIFRDRALIFDVELLSVVEAAAAK